MKPRVIVLRTTGTNCDIETAQSFKYAGADADIAHINELLSKKKKLSNYSILSIPGGFSYGDDISAGKIFSLKMRVLKKEIEKFIKDKKPVIGICNGFQVLVKAGYLPENKFNRQIAALFTNDNGHFLCKWVKVKLNKKSPCIFTRDLPETFDLPIAHGEGKFIVKNKKTLKDIISNNLNVLSYIENPNGSIMDIAGLCNKDGNIFGLMPHPERNFFSLTSGKKNKNELEIGYYIFKNAVDYVR